jgi:ABC-2 type transport system ATP-binding protein
VPHEPLPDDPDDSGAPVGDGRIVEFVKNPRSSSDSGSRPPSDRAKRTPKARAPRTRKPQVVAPDPGPPPPLPPVGERESVILPPKAHAPSTPATDDRRTLPPKPEMPADVAAAAAAAAAELASATTRHDAAVTASAQTPVHAEVETEPSKPEAATEPEPATDPAVATEPELTTDPAVAAEPELTTEPEFEPQFSTELDVEAAVEPSAPETIVVTADPPLADSPSADPVADESVDVDAADIVVEAASPVVEDSTTYAELADVAPELVVTEFEADATVAEGGIERDDEEDDPLAYVYEQARLEASFDEESAALMLRGVSKSFGDMTAVEAIDLTVPAGTFYGLVGPNGAGKTTTLSMIAGLLTPDRGVIRVGGVDAASDPLAAKKLMGVLPDRLRTFDRLTGRQLLYYYGILRGLAPRVVETRSADLARAFDLTEALGRVVSDYSAGMLKKVMLAGALIHSPRVLVLDEPFESVDPVSSAVILDILSAYVAHGGTVILSSHGMELVERVCTRVAVIVAGQVLAEGTIDEVRGELTLEQRFVELAGGLSDVEGLEWLHTFSD